MTVKQLWEKACKFDGIDPKSKFVVFSDSNPWAAKYNKAVALVLKFLKTHPIPAALTFGR